MVYDRFSVCVACSDIQRPRRAMKDIPSTCGQIISFLPTIGGECTRRSLKFSWMAWKLMVCETSERPSCVEVGERLRCYPLRRLDISCFSKSILSVTRLLLVVMQSCSNPHEVCRFPTSQGASDKDLNTRHPLSKDLKVKDLIPTMSPLSTDMDFAVSLVETAGSSFTR